ncbi:MAG TPA: DNA methyltransferase [Flavitalea sp.]|nr:DNA methyltransferase [Flavitalea sp.]
MTDRKQQYLDFLISKIKVAEKKGITVDAGRLHSSTLPHQRDIILWALQLGRALIAPDCGLGKSHISIEMLRILQEEFGGKCLIVTELGASETFCNDDPQVGEGARLGVNIEYITSTEQALQSDCTIVCTNYERVRMGSIDFSQFTAVVLDEGNYIKNMASETTEALRTQLKKVRFKYVCTATPSPNETLELVNYAHALDIADRGQILTRFFQRNSTKAGELTIHPQHEADFWLWVHSWMVAIEKPSDLGYGDEGYDLPELEIIWHEVKLNKAIDAGVEKDGQARMFMQSGNSLPDNAKLKRESIDVRTAYAVNLMAQYPEDTHWLLWHHLEDERKALNKSVGNREGYADLYGAQPWEVKEKRIVSFSKGEIGILATKPSISAVGCNFQKHCADAILLGVDNDWNLLYQLAKRVHRFGQKRKCTLHILYLPEEYAIVQNLKAKQQLHNEQRMWLRRMVQQFGLSHDKMIEERRRTLLTSRKEFKGEKYNLINTDAVLEWFDLPDNSIDLINSSFPFGNHYEYTSYYNDFGHNATNQDFIRQMDFLLPELYRTMKPGRIVAVHLKNRIHYGSVTGLGFSIFHRFTHLVCDAMEKHGFHTMGFHYIPTCVVGENNQTYRLTYGELQKDSTKMGSGIPEEIWLFRKPPTSNANAYADEPVTHNDPVCPCCAGREFSERQGSVLIYCTGCKQYFLAEEINAGYSLSQWQIDADAFWGSSGNSLLTPFEMKSWGLDKIRAWWNRFNKSAIYDYDKHISLLQELDDNGKLSRTFTTLPLQSNTPYIWDNVNRMHGLNMEQSRRKQRNHICPQPRDEARRVINLYSNPGELIADPFGGLGTTGVEAIALGRRTLITELNEVYAVSANVYLKESEQKQAVPTLFDLLTA